MRISTKVIFLSGMMSLIGCSMFQLCHLDSLDRKLNNFHGKNEMEHKQRIKYAVLINGDSSKLHQDNVTEAYKSLRYLGFENSNIFLLTSNYPRPDDGQSITFRATKTNLKKIWNYLGKAVDDNDLVLVYTTGHGSKGKSESGLTLEKEDIAASDLKNLISKTKARDYVVVSDQCYSGGMVKKLSELEGRVTCFSSTDSEHITYCKDFARSFWKSFRNGKADVDCDGTTTLDEAFNYASRKHQEGGETNTVCQVYRTSESPNTFR